MEVVCLGDIVEAYASSEVNTQHSIGYCWMLVHSTELGVVQNQWYISQLLYNNPSPEMLPSACGKHVNGYGYEITLYLIVYYSSHSS